MSLHCHPGEGGILRPAESGNEDEVGKYLGRSASLLSHCPLPLSMPPLLLKTLTFPLCPTLLSSPPPPPPTPALQLFYLTFWHDWWPWCFAPGQFINFMTRTWIVSRPHSSSFYFFPHSHCRCPALSPSLLSIIPSLIFSAHPEPFFIPPPSPAWQMSLPWSSLFSL